MSNEEFEQQREKYLEHKDKLKDEKTLNEFNKRIKLWTVPNYVLFDGTVHISTLNYLDYKPLLCVSFLHSS